MVDLESRLVQVKEMVDKGKYFVINRGRQYGKTTLLKAVKKYLEDEYIIIDMDFQMQMSQAKFETEKSFCEAFFHAIIRISARNQFLSDKQRDVFVSLKEKTVPGDMVDLFYELSDLCNELDKPVILMIDEVDQASNNQVFLDFLSQLIGYYLNRENIITFQSVILAGVHDVRNLRQKIRPDMEHKHNSPWNIATKFEVDMSFSSEDISGMLKEYEKENNTGMNIDEMAKLIYDYTSGYPVLVSGLCKLIDEEIAGTERFATKKSAWTKAGFLEAEKKMMSERMPLFESLINKLEDDEALRSLIHMILFEGNGEIKENKLEHYEVG